jgi:hypothetical protein
VIDEWPKAAATRMAFFPDFEKVVFTNDVPITAGMIRLMTPSPLAADIAYNHGTNKLESLIVSKITLVVAARAESPARRFLPASRKSLLQLQ